MINLALITLTLAVFLIQGLFVLSELRESCLEKVLSQYYQRGVFNLGIRYVSFAFVGLALTACYQCLRKDLMQSDFKLVFDLMLHNTILWITSSELIHWLNPKYALALANCIFDKENQSFSGHFDWLSTGASLH